MILKTCMISCTAMSRVCNGLCIITIAVLRRGVGSTTTIMLPGYQVRRSPFRMFHRGLRMLYFKDLRGVDQMTFHFDLGHPFKPFEQLMGVLPSASKDLIPQAYQVCCIPFTTSPYCP